MKKLLVIFSLISLMLVMGAACQRKTVSDAPVKKPAVKKQVEEKIITNYAECIVAGNKMLQSTPRQCKTPDGRVFTERYDLPMPTDLPPEPPSLPDTNLPED